MYKIIIVFVKIASYNSFVSVNGKWQKYGNWSSCSENCVQYAERECTEPQFGGRNCQGNAKKQQFCNDGECKGE